jgi:predicted nucleic acid-binding Zn ribbon protein
MKDNWKKYVVKHNDRNIREVLSDMIDNNQKLQKGYSTVRIKEAWKKEMGDIICSYTQKMYFREGVLTVYLTSAPLRNELSMSKQKVIDLINKSCKEEIIKSVIFK